MARIVVKLPRTDGDAPPTVYRSDKNAEVQTMPDVCEVHATSGPPNPPHARGHVGGTGSTGPPRGGPESALRLRASLAAKAAASRKAWEAFYEKEELGAAAPNPLTTALSAGLASALLTPSMVKALEERFELQPGELTSGAVTVLRMAKRSTQAEATIYDPRRKRRLSAVVDLLASEDLRPIADALRLLKRWADADASGGRK